MSEWITRDQARNHFRKCGLTYRDVKRAHINLLLSLLDTEFEASRNNPESRDNLSPRISDKIIYVPSYENGSEIGMQCAHLYMNGAYFSERECISFNRDGFIGFAGWASDGNVQPILGAFIRWCDLLAGDAEWMPKITASSVTATLVDENTLSVNGTLFVRKRADEEVLLQPMQDTIAPKLRCSNCHYERAYYYWYKALHYQERVVNFCPGCGHPILGVVTSGQADT